MDMRERLRKAAGLFIELPPEDRPVPPPDDPPSQAAAAPARTVEQLVRESAGPNLDEIHVPHTVEPPAVTPDGRGDFRAIYEHAGVPPAPFTAEQMRDMLQSLPAELPLAMQRQTVSVALSAMGKSIGATPDTIVADASRKLAALTSYADSLSAQTAATAAAAEREIAALEAEIQEKRQQMAAAQQSLTAALQACHAESDRLDDVLEFFSLDVPPSRHGNSEAAS